MPNRVRNRHFFLSDICLIPLAAYLSFVLRLDKFDLVQYWPGYVLFTALCLIGVPLVFRWAGVYARYWQYASLEELVLLASALVGVVVVGVGTQAARLVHNALVVPRSIPFIFGLLALVATAGPRLVIRLAASRRRRVGRVRPVLVVGAGQAGVMLVRELRYSTQIDMDVLGFVDDDPMKQKMRVLGVPVLGDRHALPQLIQHYNIACVIIAIPTASGKIVREIVSLCEQCKVEIKIIPGIYKLLGGGVTVNALRPVEIDDLLRRAPLQGDIAAVSALVRGKRVLVTGGGGSIGGELCRQVLRCGPAALIVVGHGENSVFGIENELRRLEARQRAAGNAPPCTIHGVIADIRFADRLRVIFDEHRPDLVLHAAAHKHVPLMEMNPAEAVTNNVLGTRNVLNAALAADVERFVMISTDKAVNPSSIMGASKRVAEFLVHRAAERSKKPYVAVRFGNVLGSRGSVVLSFKEQIVAGGPVTVTHPDVRRYFMTIPEAVHLVLQAAVLGRGGEVFVLDMGEPIRIVDLARDMIELSGLEVGRDIDIEITGLRPGEKLFEELFVTGEDYHRTRHDKIFIAANASSFVPRYLDEGLLALQAAAERNDRAAIVGVFQELIPEYQPRAAPHMPAPVAEVRPVMPNLQQLNAKVR